KIRVGQIEGERRVGAGDELRFVDEGVPLSTPDDVPTTYAGLSSDVRPGDDLLLRDGAIPTTVMAVEPGTVTVRVVAGGTIRTGSGINLPDSPISAPALSDDDAAALRSALDDGVDLVALSFVRSPDDVEPVRAAMAEHGRVVPIIAKIEKPEAVEQIDAVVAAFDGVMVARGDLGVELDLALVPMIQKRIITACRHAAKPVIVATEMLESMTSASRPTRAEASDVVNAVLDGADALMLSAETSMGIDPVRAAITMDRLVRIAERDGPRPAPRRVDDDPDEATVAAAIALAERCAAEAIVVITRTGSSARRVAAHRPDARLLVFSPDELSEPWTVLWGAEVVDRLLPGSPLPDDLRGALTADFDLAADAAVVVVTGSVPGATDLVWRL
ncbi:MAG TPA: pyruvate kinase, partial [Acidimicrobiales bacterium]|nr:pyruvate kinase [Acidimicrobiales bacterium]